MSIPFLTLRRGGSWETLFVAPSVQPMTVKKVGVAVRDGARVGVISKQRIYFLSRLRRDVAIPNRPPPSLDSETGTAALEVPQAASAARRQ